METQNNSERINKLLQNIEEDLRALKQLLGAEDVYSQDAAFFGADDPDTTAIEGIFDGERMVDYTGKGYQVSANYASKSKLVEGDPLKLYITADGKFYYKQLGPVPRKTVAGQLKSEGNHYVIEGEDGVIYNVLTASVTYYMSLFNVRPGDRLLIMVPAEGEAHWAVIDNVL